MGKKVISAGHIMKILGADVSLIARTGDDVFGEIVRSGMAKYGAGDAMRAVEGGDNCPFDYPCNTGNRSDFSASSRGE